MKETYCLNGEKSEISEYRTNSTQNIDISVKEDDECQNLYR